MLNKQDYKVYSDKMDKSIIVLDEQLSGIRAGRANPRLLSNLLVEYYGVPTPISQVGSISVPEARVMLITPWDPTVLKAIEKEIYKSDIGITPNNDGKAIRLVFPPLTEERRKDLTKQVKRIGEDTKIAIRAIRRDAIDTFKTMQKKSEITEDDLKDAEKEMQNLTDKHIEEVDNAVVEKEKEIMEI